MTKIYISGKITGIENEAPKLFKDAENHLQSIGYYPINPMELNHNHDKTWHSYMKEGVKALCECEKIYMLKNYKESKGALIELEIANHLGIEVMHQP